MFFILSISTLQFEHPIPYSKINQVLSPQILQGSCRPFTFQGAREPKPTVSFNHQRCPSGCNGGIQGGLRKPLPPPLQMPCNSFQAKLNCSPCLFEDVHIAYMFDSSEWPLAHYSACRESCIIHMRPAPSMDCLTIYPLNILVNLKKTQISSNIFKNFPDFSLTSHKNFLTSPKISVFPDRKISS